MLIRIVRMQFRPDALTEFRQVFEAYRAQIAAFPGCKAVQLCVDAGLPNVYYTHSQWRSAADLDAYRHSDLFREVWGKTKPLFEAKPMAFSLVPPPIASATDALPMA